MALTTKWTIIVGDVTTHTDEEIVNGDPYAAVLISDSGPQTAPETHAVTLGTGFESLRGISRYIESKLNDDDIDGLEFVPVKAEVFSLCGTVEIDATSQIVDDQR